MTTTQLPMECIQFRKNRQKKQSLQPTLAFINCSSSSSSSSLFLQLMKAIMLTESSGFWSILLDSIYYGAVCRHESGGCYSFLTILTNTIHSLLKHITISLNVDCPQLLTSGNAQHAAKQSPGVKNRVPCVKLNKVLIYCKQCSSEDENSSKSLEYFQKSELSYKSCI